MMSVFPKLNCKWNIIVYKYYYFTKFIINYIEKLSIAMEHKRGSDREK